MYSSTLSKVTLSVLLINILLVLLSLSSSSHGNMTTTTTTTTTMTTQSFFVDGVNGNDEANGTLEAPWRTLNRAQTAIQEINNGGGNGEGAISVQVLIRAGSYVFIASPWSFESSDFGGGTSAISSVVWTAYEDEIVDIVAGIPVAPSSWVAAPSIAGAYVLDFNAVFQSHNLSLDAIGTLPGPNSLGDCSAVAGMELFFNGTAMNLARYPNIAANGTWLWEFAAPGSVNLSIAYVGDRPSQWVNETNLRIHGFWQFDWADSWVEISNIDTVHNVIQINPDTPPLYGSVAVGARWMLINALSELDAPGEYYIDNVNYLLYFIPPFGSIESESWLSIGSNVLVLNNLASTSFNNLNFYYAQQSGIIANAVTNVYFTNCTVANHGREGISISGFNSSVSFSSIFGTGCGGINGNAGDTTTLTSGLLSIDHNWINDFGRIIRTYTPGIGFGGVGNYYGYNSIENGPHAGILGGGNNLLIEYNYLYRLCYETTDAGAFYTGRSWSQWGNYLQHNVFNHVIIEENTAGGVGTTQEVQAIYLDDQMSGWQVFNNTIIEAAIGVLVGGGRMNNITQNHFQNCKLGIYLDNRGMNWQSSACQPPNGLFEMELDALNYTEPPYSVQYPWLPMITKDQPCVPVRNHFVDNTYCQVTEFIDQDQTNLDAWEEVFENNVEVSC